MLFQIHFCRIIESKVVTYNLIFLWFLILSYINEDYSELDEEVNSEIDDCESFAEEILTNKMVTE